MICLSRDKQGPDVLIEYLGGTLDPARSAELERHMEECADCRGLAGVRNTLDEWTAPEVSSDFDQRLYARIAAEQRAPWWSWQKLAWRPAIPLAACAALLAGFLMVRPPAPVEPLKARMESVNIEQVEEALDDMDLLTPLAPGQAGTL